MHVDEQLTVPTKSRSKKKTSQPKKQSKGTLQSTFQTSVDCGSFIISISLFYFFCWLVLLILLTTLVQSTLSASILVWTFLGFVIDLLVS